MNTKTALQKATDLLARQDQSERSLKRKLAARNYAACEIDDAVDQLKRHNYINDAESCARQFERLYSEGKLSVNQIYAKLVQRGFETSLIDKFLPPDVDEHEKNAALRALRTKFNRLQEDRKLYQHLSTRGFSGDAIIFAVEQFKSEFEAN